MKMIKVFILLVGWLLTPLLFASSLHSLKYEMQFKTAFSRYMPGHDYRLLKAQCFQESRFEPRAVSPIGAAGLCQFMPFTWKEAQSSLRFSASVFSAQHNILAAAWYDSQMYRFWSSPRPVLDRYNLMFASYNAGAGNIHKAQIRCNNALLFNDIMPCLPQVTGRHADETRTYVRRINEYYRRLK
ncbi:transglycosylase SLT domain-containing protein [Psychromonas sp. PT13]|uniref:transglycosylase SLT domain-containing protein n=1 Tax=Psychromonas sp. PT13 TaxID=3439547 RepID=UPI003EB744CA